MKILYISLGCFLYEFGPTVPSKLGVLFLAFILLQLQWNLVLISHVFFRAITLVVIGTTKVATMLALETTKDILEAKIGEASVNFLTSILFCLYYWSVSVFLRMLEMYYIPSFLNDSTFHVKFAWNMAKMANKVRHISRFVCKKKV